MKILSGVPFNIETEKTLILTGNLPGEIEIKNGAGKIFFLRRLAPGEQTIKVNLNKPGEYTANFNADAQIQPLTPSICVNTLPEKERDLRTEINILPAELEKTPARIFANFGVIQYDKKKFSELPIPYKIFILYHEIGHFFYTTEWKCDIFALYHFCRDGWNPSQAFYCLSDILDAKKPEGASRIKNLFSSIPHFKN